ncbi:aegerolysin family protein [Acinetobacter dispersus]|uniref:aegerolysin family protein n=1 Tax=Acinetobacter dispersus TaxID=70348 RepID=UPI001F4A9E06|nr:aegerolysin family protein [Acinetobacter dispersus]MCH7395965.1 aegerolysin family protein [Acinetobacter dispersus]
MTYQNDEDQKIARILDKIGGNSGGGGRAPKLPGQFIYEGLVPSAEGAFQDAKNAVEKGISRVGEEFANIFGFRSGAARSTKVTLVNQTPFHLVKVKDHLGGGIWMKNQRPPETIEPGKTVIFGSESNGIATGTEGSVDYRICGVFEKSGAQDTGMNFQVYWNNPYHGSNKVSHGWPNCDASNPFWNDFSLGDPNSIRGDNSEVQWVLKYVGTHSRPSQPSTGDDKLDKIIASAKKEQESLSKDEGLSRTVAIILENFSPFIIVVPDSVNVSKGCEVVAIPEVSTGDIPPGGFSAFIQYSRGGVDIDGDIEMKIPKLRITLKLEWTSSPRKSNHCSVSILEGPAYNIKIQKDIITQGDHCIMYCKFS